MTSDLMDYGQLSPLFAGLIIVSMTIAALILLNMLVGVLVEVVATVMHEEQARTVESVVRIKLKELMETTSFDQDITKEIRSLHNGRC